MLSFAELLKAIDKFYRIASDLPDLIKLAVSTPMYEKVSEDIFDKIVNDEFAQEFERYMDVYNELISDLDSRDSKDAVKALNARPDDPSEEDTFKDLYWTLANRAEAMRDSAYLSQSPEDWEESLSPKQIADGISELGADALNRIVAKVKGLMSREEVIDRLSNIASGMVMAPTERKMNESQEDFEHRTNVKQQQYQREYSDKLAALRMILEHEGKGDKDQGAGILNQYIANLQNQLKTETNAVKREEIERRLKNMPDPMAYQKRLLANQARYEKIQDDPIKGPEYNKRRAPRQRKTRNRRAEMLALIEQYLKAISPNDKARLAEKIISLREQILLSSSYGLDVQSKAGVRLRDREDIKRILNIDNIIKEFTGRAERVRREEVEKYQRDKAKMEKGDLDGLIIVFRRSVNNMISDATKDVNAVFAKTEPDLIPLKQAVDKFRKGDPNKAQAEAALKAALNTPQYVNKRKEHPALVALNAVVELLRNWRDEVEALQKGFAQRTDETGAVILNDAERAKVIEVITSGAYLVRDQPAIITAVKGHMHKILTYLHSMVK